MAPRAALLAALLATVAACGAGRTGPRVSSPFTEADATAFDDAVDRLATPEGLPEGFRERWQRRLCMRSSRSDVVAVVTVRNLRLDTNPDRVSRYRVVAHVERQLFGDEIEELALSVREGDIGWDTVAGREDKILGGTFIAYVKWYHRADEGEGESLDARREADEEDDDELPVDAHWHLSPASEQVLRRTERALASREEDD